MSRFHANDLIKPAKGTGGQAFFAHFGFQFTAEHRRLDAEGQPTDEGFTVRIHGLFREVSAEQLTGTVFRFTSVETVHMIVRDADGGVLLKRSARMIHTDVFDTGNDKVPGGTPIGEGETVVVRGTAPPEEFCEVLALIS